MKSSVTVLSILLLSVSCSDVNRAKKNMTDMKDTTQKMSKTTEKMSSNMDSMKEITKEMKETTDNMYQQIRSKESRDTRVKELELLLNESTDIGKKITAAGAYFQAFEFQLWTGNGADDEEKRQHLFLDAANEFTRVLCDIYKELKPAKMSPTHEGKKHNLEMAFYALSATMHVKNDFQRVRDEKNHMNNSVSMYDMVKSALSKDFNGEALNENEEILLTGINKETMIELMKARVDFLAALGVKNLTDKRKMGLGQKALAALFKITGGALGKIDLPETYSPDNSGTNPTVETYLNGAVKAKNFLFEIEVAKPLEKTIRSALKNIDFNEPKRRRRDRNQVQEEAEVTDKQKAILQGLIAQLLE